MFPADAKINKLKGSCLSVHIQEERLCEGCEPVIVESFVQKNLQMSKTGSIPYRMIFDGKAGVPYIVMATLNIGWCKQGDKWIRPGDYHTVTASFFNGLKQGESAGVNVNMEGYKIEGINVNRLIEFALCYVEIIYQILAISRNFFKICF